MTGSPTVLVLNSAQSRYPRGDDGWVRATVRAFDRLAGADLTMLTSADPLMWDLSLYLAAERGMRIRHIVPDFDRDRAAEVYSDTMTVFNVSRTCTSPIYLDSTRSLSRADIWRHRDKMAIKAADVVYPVSIRPGGRLASLLDEAVGKGSDIRDAFRTVWRASESGRTRRYNFAAAPLNQFPPGEWLVHWTRSSPGYWPGEPPPEFFADMLARPGIYVRSARETLARIVINGLIRPSDWKIPGGTPVVSLTENTPEAALALMRWRKRFVRYTYEPYGVAIRRDALVGTGARKVMYAVRSGDPGKAPWAVQSPGVAADWTRESEWRHPGGIRLDSLDPRDWFAVVPATSDAACITSRCEALNGRVFVLFDT